MHPLSMVLVGRLPPDQRFRREAGAHSRLPLGGEPLPPSVPAYFFFAGRAGLGVALLPMSRWTFHEPSACFFKTTTYLLVTSTGLPVFLATLLDEPSSARLSE
jgi:hypothetical protein